MKKILSCRVDPDHYKLFNSLTEKLDISKNDLLNYLVVRLLKEQNLIK